MAHSRQRLGFCRHLLFLGLAAVLRWRSLDFAQHRMPRQERGAHSRIVRYLFQGGAKLEMPDLSGDKRKAAAMKLAMAKQALEEAQEFIASGASDDRWYRVTTEGDDGIGIRETPDLEGARTGDDLKRGTIFEVTEVLEREDYPTFLCLADGRGWVFDTSPVDPENPSVQKIEGMFGTGQTLAELERDVEEARLELDSIRGAKKINAD
eukprot:TRINITY_DN93546_c0_g1_i1.p1 TRINITY_DN93546_c0_g1~~TRINITY_DN93546_c0_g1_i1.p1  ORF type:complete len:218 (+),score=28.91 TRINITY_DN93546_c0_g1_i1:33-656(+)